MYGIMILKSLEFVPFEVNLTPLCPNLAALLQVSRVARSSHDVMISVPSHLDLGHRDSAHLAARKSGSDNVAPDY